MEQQRRQQREGDRVTPVERPVEAIERAVEREREDAEERDAEPEEMERRLIARTPQAHRGADQQREQADRGEHEIHRVAARRRRERERERLARARPQEGVDEPRPGVAAMLILDDVGRRQHRRAVDREQHVAALDPGGRRGGAGRHLAGGDAFRAPGPEHAVLDLVPARVHRDVGDAERDEQRHDGHRKHGSTPDEPAGLGGIGGIGDVQLGLDHFRDTGPSVETAKAIPDLRIEDRP